MCCLFLIHFDVPSRWLFVLSRCVLACDFVGWSIVVWRCRERVLLVLVVCGLIACCVWLLLHTHTFLISSVVPRTMSSSSKSAPPSSSTTTSTVSSSLASTERSTSLVDSEKKRQGIQGCWLRVLPLFHYNGDNWWKWFFHH